MATPAVPAPVSPRSERLFEALQSLASDTIESDAVLHVRIDQLALRLQNLCNMLSAFERRLARLEGSPQTTDSQGPLFLQELD